MWRSWGAAGFVSRNSSLDSGVRSSVANDGTTMLDFRTLWDRALTYAAFLAASTKHKGLWEGIYSIARLPEWAVRAFPPGVRHRLLVIAEEWCGDASST